MNAKLRLCFTKVLRFGIESWQDLELEVAQ